MIVVVMVMERRTGGREMKGREWERRRVTVMVWMKMLRKGREIVLEEGNEGKGRRKRGRNSNGRGEDAEGWKRNDEVSIEVVMVVVVKGCRYGGGHSGGGVMLLGTRKHHHLCHLHASCTCGGQRQVFTTQETLHTLLEMTLTPYLE